MRCFLISALAIWLAAALPFQTPKVFSQPRALLTADDFRRIGVERRNAANGTAALRPVHRYNQLAWLFAVGTPAQQRFLVFDTASTETFVGSNKLDKRGINIDNSETALLVDNKYSASKYGARLRGQTYRDVLTLGWVNVQTTNDFGLIHQNEGAEDAVLPFQVGMGWKPNALKAEGPAGPVIHGFFDSLYGEDSKYQVFANRTHIALSVGGETLCSGEALYFDVLKDRPIPMLTADSFKLGPFEDSHSYPLTLDSSVGAVMLPAVSYRYALKHYGAQFDAETGLFLVDCNAERSNQWEFTIAGKSVAFGDSEIIYKSEFAENQCALMVAKDLNAEPQYVLGTPIFGKYCVTFDVKANKIGLMADPKLLD